MLTVEAKQLGRNHSPTTTTQFPNLTNPRPTLRALITHVVKQQVAAFDEVDERPSVLPFLTAEQIADGAQLGRIGFPIDRQKQQQAQHAQAVNTALDAFQNQHYFVFVNEQQIESLDEVLALHADSKVLFVRLVPLVGG